MIFYNLFNVIKDLFQEALSFLLKNYYFLKRGQVKKKKINRQEMNKFFLILY